MVAGIVFVGEVVSAIAMTSFMLMVTAVVVEVVLDRSAPNVKSVAKVVEDNVTVEAVVVSAEAVVEDAITSKLLLVPAPSQWMICSRSLVSNQTFLAPSPRRSTQRFCVVLPSTQV